MKFSNSDRLKAIAIVNIFETSRPFGNFAACVVLDDGAGISYGISQFTHRSGSLLDVVETYLALGGTVGADVIWNQLASLKMRTKAAIDTLAADDRFRNALRQAAATPEMREAQWKVTIDRYMAPAERECLERGFVQPLSLAVVYDSMIHGSWQRLAATISERTEERWITDYVRGRHQWLSGIARLRATTYRTRFFLGQIAISNWQLKLPVTVNGHRLTASAIASHNAVLDGNKTNIGHHAAPAETARVIKGAFGTAAEKFDQVETVVNSVVRRTDAAKSLWTTVGGTLWQAAWGLFGFIAGVPRGIWIVVALIAAALMLFYLYRQLALGKIRETASQINN